MTKWPLRGVVAAAIALMLSSPLRAQLPTMSEVDRDKDPPATGPLPLWDVASLKPHPAEDHMMSWRTTPDGLSLVNLSLEQLICNAWDMKPYQLSGLSGWMKNTNFDLTAKVSGEDVAAYKKLNTAQRREMLQKLLTERFQLKVRTETRTLPVYDLVVDKNGPRLKPSTAIDPPSPEELKANPEKYKPTMMTMGPGMFEGTGVSLGSLAGQLENALDKPVHDTTGLTGTYDITIHYRPEGVEASGGDNSDAPSVFTAVQELGLKLLPSKGPVETLIVDAAQKPEAN